MQFLNSITLYGWCQLLLTLGMFVCPIVSIAKTQFEPIAFRQLKWLPVQLLITLAMMGGGLLLIKDQTTQDVVEILLFRSNGLYFGMFLLSAGEGFFFSTFLIYLFAIVRTLLQALR